MENPRLSVESSIHHVPDDTTHEPYIPLLAMTDRVSSDDDDNSQTISTGVNKKLRVQLYTSHFLSTWNSRLFEFGAVLFLASIFPGTLLPMSVYALVRSAAAIVFAQPIGSWIDRGNRLAVVRVSIVGQRVAVAASCVVLWILSLQITNAGTTWTLFAALILLACVEKLCSVMNLISVERDWVGQSHIFTWPQSSTYVRRSS